MKRLAVLVKNEKVDAVVVSLSELNLDAVVYDVKSVGKEIMLIIKGLSSFPSPNLWLCVFLLYAIDPRPFLLLWLYL